MVDRSVVIFDTMSSKYEKSLKRTIGKEFSSKGLSLSGSAGRDILSVLKFVSFFVCV